MRRILVAPRAFHSISHNEAGKRRHRPWIGDLPPHPGRVRGRDQLRERGCEGHGLPRHAASAEPATKVGAPRHIATAEARRRGRVLIVDDEPLIGAAARRVLESEHEVVVMSSAAEAMSTIRGGERYDVILCDMSMPQATGMEFYDELAGRDPKQAARVIFMTGGASSPRARALLDMHSGQWIEKPVSVDVLCAAVNGRIAVSA